MNKLVGVIMAGNCENTISMCIKSIVHKVDEVIVLYDTTSKDDTYKKIYDCNVRHLTILQREYEHGPEFKNANSNARNYYLQYLKQHNLGDWVIVMDADEVMSDNFNKETIMIGENSVKNLEEQNCLLISPKMIHFQQDLGHEDSTKDIHFVMHRFFKVHEELYYPEGEHPVLNTTFPNIQIGQTDLFTIYHLAYCREIKYIKDRYLNHSAKSEMHTDKFLQEWYYAHLFGYYPKRELDVHALPQIIKDEYLIDDDFFYFKNRGLEPKHFIDVSQWKDWLKENECPIIQKMLFVGDGKGVRTFAARTIGIDAQGFDLSEYAVKNNIGNYDDKIFWKGDILNIRDYPHYEDGYDRIEFNLIVAYDILEHLQERDLNNALLNMKESLSHGGHLLISVPMVGDPNLMLDNTHKIFWTREQWEQAVANVGFEIESVPEYFQFKHQLIIGRKK